MNKFLNVVEIFVSLISTLLGGGGHRNASGLKVDGIEFPLKKIDENTLYGLLSNISYEKQHELNIVFLNCTHHKKHIGKYLLQERYVEKKGDMVKSIQQASNIFRIRDDDKDFYKTFDVSWIWHMIGRKTCVTLILNDSSETINKKVKELISSFNEVQWLDNNTRVHFIYED